MIEPFLSDDALLEDIQNARRNSAGLHLWWLGQSGFLIQWNGAHALLDPYLSDSLTKKYALSDKPHVRMTRRVIAPERLDFVDVVSASHLHTDHLDPETLKPLFRANRERLAQPKLEFILPAAISQEAASRVGIPAGGASGLDDGYVFEASGFRFHAIPAAHNVIERDENGHCKFLGYVVEAGPFRIYHSGDTLFYAELDQRLKPFNLDLALLPINGNALERRVPGNLNGGEAARLAKAAGARKVVPCHYDMFEFNTASPALFQRECERIGQPFHILRAGERLTLNQP